MIIFLYPVDHGAPPQQEAMIRDRFVLQRMKSGGLMWTSPAIPIPIEASEDDDGTEEDRVPWAVAGLTEGWWDSFYGYAKGKWKPLYPDEPDGLPELAESEPPRPAGPGHVVPFRKKR
jgi:hypothetical protein